MLSKIWCYPVSSAALKLWKMCPNSKSWSTRIHTACSAAPLILHWPSAVIMRGILSWVYSVLVKQTFLMVKTKNVNPFETAVMSD